MLTFPPHSTYMDEQDQVLVRELNERNRILWLALRDTYSGNITGKDRESLALL